MAGFILLTGKQYLLSYFLDFYGFFLPFSFGMLNDYFSYLCTVLGTKVADFKLVNWV